MRDTQKHKQFGSDKDMKFQTHKKNLIPNSSCYFKYVVSV